jgi:hypothetical protein
MKKHFFERLIELVKEDKELHDATVRLINATAEEKEAKARKKICK